MKTMTPEIIFEDSDLIVFNKPWGMVVNRSDTFAGVTLQDIVEEGSLKEATNVSDEALEELEVDSAEYTSEFESRSGIVHRLDKDTSGIIIVAKNKDSFANLQKQFKDRVVEKEYRAVVMGKVPFEKIEIDAPIGRNPHNRQMLAVVSSGRESQTYVEKVKTFSLEFEGSNFEFTYLLIRPKTGRTHQIRVHLAAANFPIAADPIYCTRKQLEVSKSLFPRLMLHAYKIKFNHPKTNAALVFEAILPQEFIDVI